MNDLQLSSSCLSTRTRASFKALKWPQLALELRSFDGIKGNTNGSRILRRFDKNSTTTTFDKLEAI